MNTNFKVVSEGLTVEYLDNGMIYFHFKYQSVTRQIVDEWVTELSHHILAIPQDQPTQFIHDICETKFTLTPYLRAKINDIYAINKHPLQLTAIILKQNVATQIMSFILPTFSKKHIKNQIFYNRQDGIEWMNKQRQLYMG
jgi:hypothetical protein